MSNQTDSTIPNRPGRGRPMTGLLAWKATVGYISAHHSPDAVLTIHIYPASGSGIRWGAVVSWGQQKFRVWDKPWLADALRELWREVEQNYIVFETRADSIKSPKGYEDEEWLDIQTQDILLRLIHITQKVFNEDWQLVIIYQPLDNAQLRVQARLIARDTTVQVGGRGPSVVDACHDLYRNGARVYITEHDDPEN